MLHPVLNLVLLVTICSSWVILCCSAVGLVGIGACADAVGGAGGGLDMFGGRGLVKAPKSVDGS